MKFIPTFFRSSPLLLIIDGKGVSENELGVISVLKRTFPHLKTLLFFPGLKKHLAARSIILGADAYLTEPYYTDEIKHFIQSAFKSAKNEVTHSLELRMETLSDFIQGLAPEINNRLTPIIGFLQILMGSNSKDLTDTERLEAYNRIYSEALRIAGVVDELENFAKPRKPRKSELSFKTLMQKTLSKAALESEKNIPIETEFRVDPDEVFLDSRQITTALSAVLEFLRENADEKEGKISIIATRSESHSLDIIIEGYETVSLDESVVTSAFIPLYLRNIVHFGHEIGLASAYGLIR
ncbi:MAG: histidine kinase dimerization/phospho-acceptor domain-containing protein, partial [Planctomycetota bacterium]